MDTLSLFPPEMVRILICAVIVISFVFLNAIVMGYLERKIAGHIQRRPGPMEVGYHGILQLVVDGIKLVAKELLLPVNINRPLFRIAPLLAFSPVVLPFIVIPFSEKLQVRDFNLGLLFILAMGALNLLAILVGGWSSNNKYSLFGAMRAVAQNIAYEIPILLSLLAVVLMTNTFSLQKIVSAQSGLWFFLVQPLAFIIYFISGVAETNRAPFDLPEAESELTAGFHTEYSGMGFSLFFLAEYTNMFVFCSIATLLFLGGWSGFPLPYNDYTSAFWFLIKVYFLLILMIHIRWTYPRVRFDQLMNFAWKYLIPFSLVNLLITAVIVKL
jgi:NADH-quinone oxidoreductase subunit H